MSTAVLVPLIARVPHISPDAPLNNRKKWTVDECEILERCGVLPEKYELLDGEIIDKMGQYQPHGFCVLKFTTWLSRITDEDCILSQASANAARPDKKRNRPEPDIALYRAPTYELDLPVPAITDAIFVVEVADTTLTNDLGKKADLYARAGVPEYWVMDVNNRRLLAHLSPVNGKYTSILPYEENDSIAPLFAPNHPVRVGALLSPVPKP